MKTRIEMLCTEFEDRLTDYLDGALDVAVHSAFAEHALRCPVCHELLSEVKNMMQACRTAEVPPPSAELEAHILIETMPEAAMTCDEFEEYLTDYLDGFLPASLYHRWERHAARCDRCTELPGQVVRAIGACYTYINEEKPVPAHLHEKILQATLGTTDAEEVRAPFAARLAAYLRALLDPIVSPQFATVATMLLVAVLVLTNTVSADGSISGMYRASVRLAEQTYTRGANSAVKGAALSGDFKQIADRVTDMMSGEPENSDEKNQQKPESATREKSNGKDR
jgi:anti-sigma factor RsiW